MAGDFSVAGADTNRIVISRDQLKAALAGWDQSYRDGNCIPVQQADDMSVEEYSEACTQLLWGALGGQA